MPLARDSGGRGRGRAASRSQFASPCARATRRRASGRRWSASPPHILVTTPESLYLLLTGSQEPRDLAQRSHGDRRRNPRPGTRQTRLALGAVARPARPACARRRQRGSASRRRSGRSTRSPGSSSARPTLTPTASRGAISSTPATSASSTWRSKCRRASCRPFVRSRPGKKCTRGSAELIREHRSTLVFVNTRRMAERVCHYLEEQLGEGHVASHHGSLSRETRLRAEEQLKAGELKAIVATASLELGIDIGYIDLVCQIGSPRSIATFLQRVGRAGHALGRMPKGRLFALTRDELLGIAGARRRGAAAANSTASMPPVAPLDILAQQIVAAVACDEWGEDELFDLCREAWPYRNLDRVPTSMRSSRCLSEGISAANRSRRVSAPRSHPPPAPRTPQRPDCRDHLGRRDSGAGRLSRRDRRRSARLSARSTKTSPSRARSATCFSWAIRRGGSCTSAAAR